MELLAALALTMVVVGAMVAFAGTLQTSAGVQPEAMDMQQRARAAADALFRDLVMAGAGVYEGARHGPLVMYFAPIVPRRMGLQNADAPGVARADAITIIYVPETPSQTSLADAMPSGAATITVNSLANCPSGRPLCGLAAGDDVVVFDAATHFDLFAVTKVLTVSGQVAHHAANPAWGYPRDAIVSEVQSHTYYWDPVQAQLRHSDGYKTDMPVADDVVGLAFEYFGDPNPPTSPKPPPGIDDCLYDASGNWKGGLVLGAQGGSLAPLPLSMLNDGPWCAAGDSRFDADLLRVRAVRVTLRVQAASSAFRGPGAAFARPGTSRAGDRFLPDYLLTFDVTPRNLNLAR
jgi:hypothetical protein